MLCFVHAYWLWNATTIVLRHSQTKWRRTTRTANIFTSLIFSTHLLLPRARPRAIKGLLKCGLKGLLKCGIKAWDRSQLNPTCTRRISLLSTPRPRFAYNDILLMVGFNYNLNRPSHYIPPYRSGGYMGWWWGITHYKLHKGETHLIAN